MRVFRGKISLETVIEGWKQGRLHNDGEESGSGGDWGRVCAETVGTDYTSSGDRLHLLKAKYRTDG